jgi:hypothetical protein
MSKIQLTFEQEVEVLHYIENYKGRSPKDMNREAMYKIFNFFRPQEGRSVNTCNCLDRDTYNKVSKMIDAYTFSDAIRVTERFHSLLPQLALVKEEAEQEVEVVDNVGELDMSMFLKKKEPIAKSVPVKPRKKTVTKKK